MATILVTGANGNVASATLHALKNSGHKLIGLLRDKAKGKELEAAGVELRVGDLEQLRSVEHQFEGVDVAFLLTAPGPMAPYQSSNALWGARQGKVKHVLRLSAVGAAHDAPSLNSRLHALSDSELERSGMTYTILKPHFFTQNLMGMAKSVAEQGSIFFGLGDAKLPMIDVRDIADCAAAILANPAPHGGKTYTLTGSRKVGLAEVAEKIGAAIDKPVKYVPVPVPQMIDMLGKMGADDYRQVALRDYMSAYSGGWQNECTTSCKEITGKEPRDIDAFVTDFAAAIKR